MTTPATLNDGTATPYGMGLFPGTYRGIRMISHAGADPGFRSEFIRFPDQNLSVVVLCNSFDIAPTPIAQKVADAFLVLSQPSVTAAAPADPELPLPREISRYSGTYWNNDVAQSAHFTLDDGKLVLDGGSEGKFELRHIGNSVFLLPVAPRRYLFRFRIEPAGQMSVTVEIAGERPRKFMALPTGTTPKVPLSRYVGTYHSDELDVEWTIQLRDSALIVSRKKFDDEALAAVLPGVFSLSGFFTLVFPPTNSSVDSGWFDVSTARVRRIRFVKEASVGPQQPSRE